MSITAGPMEKFQSYAQFTNAKEFNRHTELWLADLKWDFTKSEVIALKRLIRFSVKYNGISNAKIGTVLKAIHELDTKVGVSRATFKRMVVKAKTKGMLVTVETMRMTGGQTSNLYIFQRHPSFNRFDPPSGQKMNHPNKTSNLLKAEKKEIKERIGADREIKPVDNFSTTYPHPSATSQAHQSSANMKEAPTQSMALDHTYTSEAVPKRFRDLVSCYFDNADIIEEYWRMAKHAAYLFLFEQDEPFTLMTAIDSFKQMIRSLKKGRVHHPIGYFYSIMYNKCGTAFYEDLRELKEDTDEVHGGENRSNDIEMQQLPTNSTPTVGRTNANTDSYYPGFARLLEEFGNPYVGCS